MAKQLPTQRQIDKRVPSKVRDILCETLGCAEADVTADSQITSDLNADSLDRVEIVISLEKEYGVSIEEWTADRWNTVNDMTQTIRALGAKV